MADQTFGAILYFLVIPLNFVLVVLALLDVTRRPAWQIPLWWRAFWGLLILVVWIVGPAAYLIWRTRLPPANQGSRVRRRRGRGGGKRRDNRRGTWKAAKRGFERGKRLGK